MGKGRPSWSWIGIHICRNQWCRYDFSSLGAGALSTGGGGGGGGWHKFLFHIMHDFVFGGGGTCMGGTGNPWGYMPPPPP